MSATSQQSAARAQFIIFIPQETISVMKRVRLVTGDLVYQHQTTLGFYISSSPVSSHRDASRVGEEVEAGREKSILSMINDVSMDPIPAQYLL